MSQIQVKQVIKSLCDILASFFSCNTQLNAEDFRLAKFNKNCKDLSSKLWYLAFNLMTFKRDNKENDLETVIFEVKQHFLSLGFNFSNVKTENSSRELLIAISWFISTQNIIERIVSAYNINCYDEYFKDNYEIPFEILNSQIESIKNELNMNEKRQDTLVKLNYLKWLQGDLKFKINNLYSCLTEKAKLTNKIHSLTTNLKLSCSQLFILKKIYNMETNENQKSSIMIKKYQEKLNQTNEFLSNILIWQQNENLYWKWMESVVDEIKETETETETFNSISNPLMNEQEITFIESFKNYQAEIKRTKLLIEHLKENNSTTINKNKEEIYIENNSDQLKKYKNQVKEMFLVDNDGQQDEDDNQLLESFDSSLKLTTTTNFNGINDKYLKLKDKIDLIKFIYSNEQLILNDKCEDFSNRQQDFVVIFNKS
jgi:hypothetical protein